MRSPRAHAAAILFVLAGPLSLTAPGCGRPSTRDATGEDGHAEASVAAGSSASNAAHSADSAKPHVAACEAGGVLGDGGDLRWLPPTARVAIAVDLDAPDLDAALTRLGALSRADEHDLPVMVDLELSMLGTEVPLVRELLEQVGLRPRELVKVHDPSRRPAWIVPAPCDLGTLRAALAARWQVTLRETVGGWIGGPPPVADFPFDVALLAGDRLLLTPRGAAVPVSAWVARESDSTPRDPAALNADPSSTGGMRIGDALQAARNAGRAPVVLATAGLSLLNTGGAPTGGPSAERTPDAVRTLAASGESIAEDPHRAGTEPLPKPAALGETASP